MRFQYLYWTIALVSTLVQAQRCAPPTWNEYNPSDGIISSEQRFTASGTSARNPIDFGCNTIYLLVNGTYLYSTFATSSGGTFGPPRQWNFNQFTLSNGGQIPFGQATLQIYAGSGNIASTTQTRTIFIYPYCPSATLTNPSSGGKVTTRTPILYGKSPDPFCRDIQLLLDFPNGVRQTYTTTADSSGNFQIQVNTALSDGTYFATYYGGAKFRTYGYVSSSFYLNLDACRAPTITKPANLEIVQVRRPTIEGTRQGYQEDCTSVDIFVDNARVQQNVPLTYVNNQPYYRFSRQLTTSLQPGVHTVYATVVGTNNRPNSGNSPTISFTVSNDAPSVSRFLHFFGSIGGVTGGAPVQIAMNFSRFANMQLTKSSLHRPVPTRDGGALLVHSEQRCASPTM